MTIKPSIEALLRALEVNATTRFLKPHEREDVADRARELLGLYDDVEEIEEVEAEVVRR